jgi:transposase
LFAGSDEGGENWACLAPLVGTCKLNGVNPEAYVHDVLTRLVNGWPQDVSTNSCPGYGRHQTPH